MRSPSLTLCISFMLAIVASGCSSAARTSGAPKEGATLRVVVRIDSYDEDGMLYTPDQICPTAVLTIVSPEKYVGRKIVIGLVPTDPAAEPIYAHVASLIGKLVALDLPEPLRASSYQIPPQFLHLEEVPNRVAGSINSSSPHITVRTGSGSAPDSGATPP